MRHRNQIRNACVLVEVLELRYEARFDTRHFCYGQIAELMIIQSDTNLTAIKV